jgi:hypothetical protein
MSWLWLNIPLAAVFFLATTMIPLWLVIRHPDGRAETAVRAPRAAGRAARVPVAARAHRPVAGQAHRSAA